MKTEETTTTPQFLDREKSAEYVREKFGISLTKNTLETLACRGNGPKFSKWGNRVYCATTDLDQWVQERMAKKHSSTSAYFGGR
jgi:hypothetical protein